MFTSLLMFSLRFCADFIERQLKISPVQLLICAALGFVGLRVVAGIETFGAMMALAIYAVGKTFFWPTMLRSSGIVPRTNAIAMSIMGGIGMMSAGLLGGPGLGYAKDRFTAEHLQATAPAVRQYKAPRRASSCLEEVHGLDGTKLSAAQGHRHGRLTSRPSPRPASSATARRSRRTPSSLDDGDRLSGAVPVFQVHWRLQAGAHRDSRRGARH